MVAFSKPDFSKATEARRRQYQKSPDRKPPMVVHAVERSGDAWAIVRVEFQDIGSVRTVVATFGREADAEAVARRLAMGEDGHDS